MGQSIVMGKNNILTIDISNKWVTNGIKINPLDLAFQLPILQIYLNKKLWKKVAECGK